MLEIWEIQVGLSLFCLYQSWGTYYKLKYGQSESILWLLLIIPIYKVEYILTLLEKFIAAL